jgi:hypothetical protein
LSENTWYLLILALKLARWYSKPRLMLLCLDNKAINKTEGFVNNKANTFLNAFGAGRSEVSIGGLSSKCL